MRDYIELDSGTVLEVSDVRLWPEAKKLTRKEGKRRLQAEALAELRRILKPGDDVYASVVHVAPSGMSRHIVLRVIRDNEPRNITHWVGRVLDWKQSDKTGGLIVEGCGMDMCFHTVYCLARSLFPDGSYICTGKGCRSNDHTNGDRDYTPHPHSDGGYALNKRDL
jgi:hypothetical protein